MLTALLYSPFVYEMRLSMTMDKHEVYLGKFFDLVGIWARTYDGALQ
jgi:hypothetical protein